MRKDISAAANISIKALDINKKIKSQETDLDMQFRMKENAQKAVDSTNAIIETLLTAKIQEIND